MFKINTYMSQDDISDFNALDIGKLCESMIFNKKTIVLLKNKGLIELVSFFGIRNTIMLIRHGHLELRYIKNVIGIENRLVDNRYIKKISIQDQYSIAEDFSPEFVLRKKFQTLSLIDIDELVTLIDHTYYTSSIIEGTSIVLRDKDHLKKSSIALINASLSEKYEVNDIEIEIEDSHFSVNINRDIEERLLSKRMSIDSIISRILYPEIELSFAAELDSTLSTSDIHMDIQRSKISSILEKSRLYQRQVLDFSENVISINSFVNISQAINNRAIGSQEICDIVIASSQFKDFSSSIEDDSNLLREYVQCINKKIPERFITDNTTTILSSSFGAVLSLILANYGLDAFIHSIAGNYALEKIEQFILDKINKDNWCPAHFINKINR